MKSISSGFQAELEKNAIALALVVTLTRTDGVRIFMTNHDDPISLDGVTYRNDLSFTISAVRSDSTLASDNVSIELGLDGGVFVRDDFRQGRWKKCSIEIAHVNWKDPTQGKITMRRGLVRQVEIRGNETARMEADGLLKVLDFALGRTYTPGCVAEFGDKKCKVALDFSQHRSFLNKYGVGDWVYWYDETRLTAETITNSDFSADGDRSSAQAITGWTKSTGATFIVNDTATEIVTHYDGDHVLAGTTSTAGAPEEQFVYQDVTLGASGTDIDDGKIMFALFVETAMPSSLADFGQLRIDMLDATGETVTSDRTGWYTLDEADEWREKALVMPVPISARTARIYLMTRRVGGAVANVNFANVRPFYWDITGADPTHGLIFRNGAVIAISGAAPTPWNYPTNPGFQVNPARALSGTGTQDITGWTKVSGQFRTATNYPGHVGFAARGLGLFSDDSHSGSTIKTRITMANYPDKWDPVDLSGSNLRITWQMYVIDPRNNDYTVRIRRIAVDGSTVLGTYTFNVVNFVSAQSQNLSFGCVLEPGTTFVEFEVEFIGDGSTNRMGIDDVQFVFSTVKPRRLPMGEKNSPLLSGDVDTVPTYTTLAVTPDGDITWQAHTSHVRFDTVATVTDRKDFTATVMAGSAGDYTTTKIVWLSGANAGVENIIRIFENGTKRIKMYFPNPADIQVGDRFMYTSGCQKRFAEDCKTRFFNGINFRGFPYVPGNMGDDTG